MKKIMALMLSVLLLLSSMSFAVSAAQPEISKITAGAQSVSVIFTTDIETAANLSVALTTDDGVAVPYTTSINGDTLTIIPVQEFTRDTESYIVTINDVTKVINVNTLWTPTFVADTTNLTVSGLKISMPNGERCAAVDVIDEDTVVMGGSAIIYPDYDEILNYENASLVADVYYTESDSGAWARFGFNTEYDATSYVNGQTRNLWSVRVNGNELHKRMLSNRNDSYSWVIRNYSADAINPTTVIAYTASIGSATNMTATQVTEKGTVSLPEGFYENAVKHRYVIDKNGAVGTLIMNGALVDICDTQAIYEADTASAEDVAPTKGYLFVTPYHSTSKIIVENMALITTTLSDFTVGDIDVENIYANSDNMTITLSEKIDSMTLANVKEGLSITAADGNNVDYSAKIAGNVLTITPVDGFTLDSVYSLDISADFGYSAVLFNEAYSEKFRVNKFWASDEEGFDNFVSSVSSPADSNPNTAVVGNTLYIRDTGYNTVYLKDVLENQEDYSITFDAQHYKTKAFNVFFNVSSNHAQGVSILNYSGKKLTGFGWTNSKNGQTKRDLRIIGCFDTTPAIAEDATNDLSIVADANNVTFNADGSITLPSTTPATYTYSVDKVGTKGTLFANGALIDEYETKGMFAKWNEYAAANGKVATTETTEPTKGMFVIAASANVSSANGDPYGGALAISNIVITTFEIIDEAIEIISVTTLGADGETLDSISGEATVRGNVNLTSYYSSQQPLKVIAVAFAGDELIGLDILDINNINGGATVNPGYELSGLDGLTEIKFLAWNSFSDMKPYCAHFSK